MLADLVVLIHLGFIVFVVFGGLLVLRWPRVAWVHLPAALWGAAVELGGWVCPLTPLENSLRAAAGQGGYEGGFVARYLLPLIYPADLTRELQVLLGAGVLVINLALYGWALRRRRPRTRTPPGSS
ncbi:MAG: DUF2784 domain-containing protein [Betaproteobacteria bacterium]|nr:DUF2784 domain-containing protein [Betaproteobacteria bacterium]